MCKLKLFKHFCFFFCYYSIGLCNVAVSTICKLSFFSLQGNGCKRGSPMAPQVRGQTTDGEEKSNLEMALEREVAQWSKMAPLLSLFMLPIALCI